MQAASSPLRLAILAASLALAALAGWQAAAAWQGGIVRGRLVLAGSAVAEVHSHDNEDLSSERPDNETARRKDLARAALAIEPLDAVALRQLGILEARTGKSDGLAQLGLAEKVTRRDLASQLLLVEASAQDGDLAATLAHYDRALTTHPESAKQLLPLLARAIDAPDIRSGLSGYAYRPWFPRLLTSAVNENADPAALAALVADTYAAMDQINAKKTSSVVLRQLLDLGEAGAARNLADTVLPGVSSVFSEAGFTAAGSDPQFAPLSWRLATGAAVTAQQEGEDTLVINLAGEIRALAAERMTLLGPGDYQITFLLARDPDASPASVIWQVRCQGRSGKGLMEQMTTPLAAPQREALHLLIPQDCPVQHWQLEGLGGVTQFASVVRISDVQLERQ